MSKKSHHFLTLWLWPLTYDLGKLIRSGHYHYQCVHQIWEQSIPWFLSYRVNTIAGGGRRAVLKGPINFNPALVQILVWCRPGNKPLSEPMMVSLLTHICVTRPEWVNDVQSIWVLYDNILHGFVSFKLGSVVWLRDYRKVSNIRRTKSQNLNDSHLVLKSSLPNPLKPGVKSRMKK